MDLIRGSAPITVSMCLPSLKNMTVGIERTLKRTAVSVLASVSSLATFTLPTYCSASCSMTGAMAWQGPHQVAQKSTRARPLVCSISLVKLSLVTCTTLALAMRFRSFPVTIFGAVPAHSRDQYP